MCEPLTLPAYATLASLKESLLPIGDREREQAESPIEYHRPPRSWCKSFAFVTAAIVRCLAKRGLGLRIMRARGLVGAVPLQTGPRPHCSVSDFKP